MNDDSWWQIRPSELVEQVRQRVKQEERRRLIEAAQLPVEEIARLVA